MDTFEWALRLGITRKSLFDMIARNMKIPAIKDVRRHLNIGLREAKVVVEYFRDSEQFKQLHEFSRDVYQELKQRNSVKEAQHV